MNFDTFCKFYIINYNRIRNKKLFKQYLLYSYNLLEIKRAKLKLGTVTFEIKPLVLNGILIRYTFEAVFSRQPSTNKVKKQIESIINFFNWSWDFKNTVTLIIFLWGIFHYILNTIKSFYGMYIKASILDDEHLTIILNNVFTLIETKTLHDSFIHNSSSILAELSQYLNLF